MLWQVLVAGNVSWLPIAFFLFIPCLKPLELVGIVGKRLWSENPRWTFSPALGMNHNLVNPTVFCQLFAFPFSHVTQGDLMKKSSQAKRSVWLKIPEKSMFIKYERSTQIKDLTVTDSSMPYLASYFWIYLWCPELLQITYNDQVTGMIKKIFFFWRILAHKAGKILGLYWNHWVAKKQTQMNKQKNSALSL